MDGQSQWVGETIDHDVIWRDVLDEVAAARLAYPWWPSDVVQAIAIVVEEAGEALKAANSICWGQKNVNAEELRRELIQTMAMCVRAFEETPVVKGGNDGGNENG